jgi:hypothetical protein
MSISRTLRYHPCEASPCIFFDARMELEREERAGVLRTEIAGAMVRQHA